MTGHVTPIKIYGKGTISAFTNSVAAIDIPEDGEILAVVGFITASGLDTIADQAIAELSFLSSNQIEINDARGSILEVAIRHGGDATGGGLASENVSVVFTPGSGIPVTAGERVHLHTFADTGVTPKGTFLMYLSSGPARRSKRRR